MKLRKIISSLFIICAVILCTTNVKVEAQNPDPDICNRAHYYEDWDGTGPYIYCSGMPTNCYCEIVVTPGIE